MFTKIKDRTGLIISYKDGSLESFYYIEQFHNFIDSDGNFLSLSIPIINEEDLDMYLNYLDMIKSYKLIKEYKGEEREWKR